MIMDKFDFAKVIWAQWGSGEQLDDLAEGIKIFTRQAEVSKWASHKELSAQAMSWLNNPISYVDYCVALERWLHTNPPKNKIKVRLFIASILRGEPSVFDKAYM